MSSCSVVCPIVCCKRGTPFFLSDNYTFFLCALKICIRGFILFASYYFWLYSWKPLYSVIIFPAKPLFWSISAFCLQKTNPTNYRSSQTGSRGVRRVVMAAMPITWPAGSSRSSNQRSASGIALGPRTLDYLALPQGGMLSPAFFHRGIHSFFIVVLKVNVYNNILNRK